MINGVVQTSLGLKGSPNDAVGLAWNCNAVRVSPDIPMDRPRNHSRTLHKDFCGFTALFDCFWGGSRLWRISFGGLDFMSLGTGA